MRVLLITQARVSSQRLPRKVLLPLGAGTVLDLHLRRLKNCSRVTEFAVATTHEEGAQDIVEIARRSGFKAFQGSTHDVLDRFYQVARQFKPDAVVRVTSDCPLIDPQVVDMTVEAFISSGTDYVSNCLFPSFPDGMDTEVFSFAALEKAWHEARLESEREHVTPYIWKNCDLKSGQIFRGISVRNSEDWAHFRLTLDQQEDYAVLQQLVEKVGAMASMRDYVLYLQSNPGIRKLNALIMTNEGYQKSIEKDKKR